MADTGINVKLVADASGLQSAMSTAASALSEFQAAAVAAGASVVELGDSVSKDAESHFSNLGEAAKEGAEGVGLFDAALERIVRTAERLGAFELVYRSFELLKDAFEDVTTGATEWGEKIENLSSETGISVAHLQEFQFAAQATGLQMDQLVQFTSRLSRAVLELGSTSSARLPSVLAAAGINPSDLNDSYTALLKIGDAINRLGAGSTAARALLTELGGRGAATLEPAIAKFREFSDEANRMGLVLQDQLVAQLASTQEQFNVLGAVVSSDEHLIGAALTPAMTVFANVLTEVALKINEWARSGELQTWLNVATDAVIDFGAQAVDAINTVLPLIEEMAAAVKDVAQALTLWVTPAGLESQFKEFYDNVKAIGENLYSFVPGFSAAANEADAFKSELTGVAGAANSAGAASAAAGSAAATAADKAAEALKRQVDSQFAAQKAALGGAPGAGETSAGKAIPILETPAEQTAILAAQAKTAETIITQQAATAEARLTIEKGFITNAEALGEIYKSTAIHQLEDVANRDYEIKRDEVGRNYDLQAAGLEREIAANGARSAKGQELSAQLQAIEVDHSEKLKQLDAEHVASVQKAAADITAATRKEADDRIKIQQDAAKQFEAIEKARTEAAFTIGQAAIKSQQAQLAETEATSIDLFPKLDLSKYAEQIQLAQQLAELTAQRAVAEQAADQQAYNSSRTLVTAQLADVSAQGPAYEALIAKREALDRQWTATATTDAAKISVAQQDAATSSIEAWTKAFTSMQASITSAISVVTGPLNSAIDGLISGSETVAQAFKKMALSIVEDLIRIAIEMAVVATARIAAGLVLGAAPAAGGVAGGAGGLLGGAAAAPQAIATGLNTTALTANTTAVAANTAALAGHAAVAGASTATGGVSAGAAAAQTAAIAFQTTVLMLIETTLLTIATISGLNGTMLGILSVGQLTQDNLLIQILAQLLLLNAKPSILGITYQSGGMVPGSGPVPAILHGGERVLSVEEVRQGMRPIRTSMPYQTEEGGSNINQHFNINAHDTRGFEKLLKNHRGTFEKMIREGLGRY